MNTTAVNRTEVLAAARRGVPVADALVSIHIDRDHCCTWDRFCDEAERYLIPFLDLPAGPTEVETRTQNPGTGRSPEAGSMQSNQYGTFQVHHASDAQIRFIRRLLAERDLTAATGIQSKTIESARPAIEEGKLNKKRASLVIDFLTTLPERTDLVPAAMQPASDKQVALIERLWNEKDHGLVESVKVEALKGKVTASGLIDHLFKSPKKAAPVVELESGIYQVGDRIYKVYFNQGRTHMLAKLLVLGGEGEKATWDYQGAAARFVKPEQKMTLEQAKKFGAIYGVCCNCGATLTDETSIEEGIGPVCAKRFA